MFVLGSVLRDNRLFDDVRAVLSPDDFYHTHHRTVYRVVEEAVAAGKPMDAALLYSRLKELGELENVGGAVAIGDLFGTHLIERNAVEYARLVREKATARRLIALCSEMIRDAYSPADESVAALVARFETQIFAVADGAAVDEPVTLRDAALKVVENIDARHRGEGSKPIPTGIPGLDMVIGGLHPHQLTIVAARPGAGKAQPHDEPVLTPTGWRRIGDLVPGDLVIGSDGKPTTVVAVTERGVLPCVRVTMRDRTSTVCCTDHLWFTQTRNERRRGIDGSVKTTAEIMETIRRADGGRYNHRIPLVGPVEFEPVGDLPLSPYLMGALLGDGRMGENVSFTKPEVDVQQKVIAALPNADATSPIKMGLRIRRCQRNNEMSETRKAIVRLGLDNTKSHERFIPDVYKYASVSARRQLIQGLFDTDGTVATKQQIEYSTTSERLANDVEFVARSLGGLVRRTKRQTHFTHKGEKKPGLPSWRINCRFPDGRVPVTSEKHLKKWGQVDGDVMFGQMIDDIQSVGDIDCRCITVANNDGLYVTRDFIVTHNSAAALTFALSAAEAQTGAIVFSMEMAAEEWASRAMANKSSVPLNCLTGSAKVDERTARKLWDGMGSMGVPVWIDERADHTVHTIAATARRAVRKHKVGLVIIDYLQLIDHGGHRQDSMADRVGHTSRALKILAKTLRVPVVCLSQLNRESEKRADKRPTMADLRASGSIEQDADNVILLWPQQTGPQFGTDKVIRLCVDKQRNGPAGVEVETRYVGEFTRFEAAGGGM